MVAWATQTHVAQHAADAVRETAAELMEAEVVESQAVATKKQWEEEELVACQHHPCNLSPLGMAKVLEKVVCCPWRLPVE
jgi:hypothetical protein